MGATPAGLISAIPGLGDFLNRWFAAATDAGVMFAEYTYVKIAGYKIVLPVVITVAGRRDVKIRTLSGLRDTIKFVNKTTAIEVNLAGLAGNWRKMTGPKVPEIPGLGGLGGAAAAAVGSVAARAYQQAATATLGFAGSLLFGANLGPGTDPLVDKIDMLAELMGVLRKAANAVEIVDAEGMLSRQGIRYVIPTEFQEQPMGNAVAWTMRCVADMDEDPLTLIFPEEKKEAATP
jgi:hypothetical protein